MEKRNIPSFVAGIEFNQSLSPITHAPVTHGWLHIYLDLIFKRANGTIGKGDGWGLFFEFFEPPGENGLCWAWMTPLRNDIPELLKALRELDELDLYVGRKMLGKATLHNPSPPYILDVDTEKHPGIGVRKEYHPKLFSELIEAVIW